jgi:peroxiredoxin
MVFRVWPLFLIVFSLIVLCSFSSAQALEPGDQVPDFVMHSENGAPQRLSEQIGKPVMIIWLDDCNACSERLIDWQYQAESRAVDGLVTWFVWQPQKDYKAPWSRLPVLSYRENNKDAWLFQPAPAVMLISPDGILDHLFLYRLDERKTEIASTLKSWLHNKQWLQKGIL